MNADHPKFFLPSPRPDGMYVISITAEESLVIKAGNIIWLDMGAQVGMAGVVEISPEMPITICEHDIRTPKWDDVLGGRVREVPDPTGYVCLTTPLLSRVQAQDFKDFWT